MNMIMIQNEDCNHSIAFVHCLCVALRFDFKITQVLREYGGIYLDNDCVVVNEIDRLRKHHCVVSKSSSERFIGKMKLSHIKIPFKRGISCENGGSIGKLLSQRYPVCNSVYFVCSHSSRNEGTGAIMTTAECREPGSCPLLK